VKRCISAFENINKLSSGKITGLSYNGGAASVGYAYDPRSERLTSIMSPAGSGAVFYREYTYSPAGDVATVKTAASGSEYAYAYDGLHRLTQETFNGAETLAWEYDGLGNLTAVNVAEGVEYSPLGDSVEVSFDVRNRPVAALRDAGLTVFADDGAGTRVKKVDPDATATYYVSAGHEVIGGVHTTYEFLGNVRFAQVRGAEVTYFVQDHLHSTSASLAPDGSLSESGAYLPFGADRTPASVTATAYGFTDQERDRSTGFYNYDARQYDPEASRFISPDSLLPDPYDPQQLNRYAYARNNPLKYVDPSGHETWQIDFSLSGGLGLGATLGFTGVIDDKGNISGLAHAGAGSYSGFGISGSIQTCFTTADSVDDLEGLGMSIGYSVGDYKSQFTEEGLVGPGYQGHQIGWASGPSPIPIEIHAFVEFSFSVGKTSLGEIFGKLKEWLGISPSEAEEEFQPDEEHKEQDREPSGE
jgi:RHS repeat-associated protein